MLIPLPCLAIMLCVVPKERAGAQIGTGRALLGAPIFWVEVLLVYLVTFSLRFAERSARWLFFPNDDMVLAEREIEVRARAPACLGTWGLHAHLCSA